MKPFIAVILAVIAAALIFTAYEQHQEMHRQKIERMRADLRGCLAIAPESGLCATLAQQLEREDR